MNEPTKTPKSDVRACMVCGLETDGEKCPDAFCGGFTRSRGAMTQSEALQSLISFAPSWYHSIEYRTAYVEGQLEERYTLFTSLTPDLSQEKFASFSGPDLEELVASAKNFIYLTRLEQTLTEPLPLCP